MRTNFQGSVIPTEETWQLIDGEFAFSNNETEDHPTLDGLCKRMGIGTQEEEDGSSVWSAWRSNK